MTPISTTAEATPVSEVMHEGVISATPQTTLRDLADEMYTHRVHCVVVDGLARGPRGTELMVWGIVTDLELMRATARGGLDEACGAAAASEIVTIAPSDTIGHAASLMAEHECTHLVVVSPQSGEPLGVVSSLDVAGAIARSEAAGAAGA